MAISTVIYLMFSRIFDLKNTHIHKHMQNSDTLPHIYTHTHTHTHIRGVFNKFPDFFVQAFTIVVDSWKFSMLLLYILWDDWPIFIISGSNEQLQLIGIHPTWLAQLVNFKNAISTWGHFRRTICNKILF